jgi:Ca2+-binding RTX toxin-like protein
MRNAMLSVLVSLAVLILFSLPGAVADAGEEDVRCFGRAPTIVGTRNADTLYGGTAADDVISGLGGPDSLHGRDGEDRECGDNGADDIQAGLGDDLLAGGMGPDRLNGGKGANLLLGGPGPDELDGSRRNPDVFRGGVGDDVLHASEFYHGDIVRGGDGYDTCEVDDADDVRGCEDVIVP